jgi:broad specificity phosphatase PhoE
MTTLFLARHGETPANVPGKERLRGLGDFALTPLGKRQAEELGRMFKRLGAKHVVTDDVLRTRLTADYVARALGVEPVHDPGLRPWDIGVFEGRDEVTTYPVLLRYIQDPKRPVPDGETYEDFFNSWRDAFWWYVNRARETAQPWALIVHSGHFATLDDVRLERGSTPTRDYEPPPGQILAVDALSLQVGAV